MLLKISTDRIPVSQKFQFSTFPEGFSHPADFYRDNNIVPVIVAADPKVYGRNIMKNGPGRKGRQRQHTVHCTQEYYFNAYASAQRNNNRRLNIWTFYRGRGL